jgi:phage portal protein BeeE
VAIHNAATSWNKALLDNAARPSGALVYDSGKDGAVLSAEQFARLKAEMEAAYQGAINAGRPMLLEGGLKWQALSMTPAEMDFVALKASAAREIALAFGVPPMLLGLPGDNTYANYKEAKQGAVAADDPAADDEDIGRHRARTAARLSGAGADGRPRQGVGAGGRAQRAVGAGERCGVPE